MVNYAKSIARENMESGNRELYDIQKRDLQAMDKKIAQKLSENEKVRQECLLKAGGSYVK